VLPWRTNVSEQVENVNLWEAVVHLGLTDHLERISVAVMDYSKFAVSQLALQSDQQRNHQVEIKISNVVKLPAVDGELLMVVWLHLDSSLGKSVYISKVSMYAVVL